MSGRVERLSFSNVAAALIVSAGAATAVSAATFAGGVVSYDRGDGDTTWSNPSAAVGGPDGVSGENPSATNYFGFPNVLSPFSGAYQGDEIVEVGEGGQLTLRLARYAVVGTGKRLGVVTNVGLQDSSYPGGQNFNPAKAFGAGSAEVPGSAGASATGSAAGGVGAGGDTCSSAYGAAAFTIEEVAAR